MAQNLLKHKHNILTLTLFLFSFLLHVESHKFSRNLKPLSFKKQKLTHLHFYIHEANTGANLTAMEVAESAVTKTSKTAFGSTVVIDDPLTVGPKPTSKIVGRAQGIYASSDLSHFSFFWVINYVFVEGKYNGSTLSIMGRNEIFLPVREMPIVGGSGLFRFARGYALVKTLFLDIKTANYVAEYDVYVQHY